jgi:hypothetical protein
LNSARNPASIPEHAPEQLQHRIVATPKVQRLIDSDDASSTPEILLLSGLRGCDNLNNDSIAVRVRVGQVAVLFTGDAENEGDSSCDPELPALEDRFQANHLLAADVYHVAHHGSYNGTSGDFMTTVSPKISVISAGDPNRRKPGSFHAWQFGHPRAVAVDTIEQTTSGSRKDFTSGATSKNVIVLTAVKKPKHRAVSKAVYCTCWDGDVVVSFAAGQTTPSIRTTEFVAPLP